MGWHPISSSLEMPAVWVIRLWNMASPLWSKPTRGIAGLEQSHTSSYEHIQIVFFISSLHFSLTQLNHWLCTMVKFGSYRPLSFRETEINQIGISKIRKRKDIKKNFMGKCKVGRELFFRRTPWKALSPSMLPEGSRDVESPTTSKSNLAAIKQPDSDILWFLTNTHPPTGLGDTWQPGQVVKIDYYKMSIFQNYNLCSIRHFPWKSTLLRAIKRWLA